MVTALSALVVAAVAAAYVQCSVFGIIARLPPNCSEGFMSGQAIAGTVASAVQLVSVYIDQKRPRLKAEDWDEGVGLLRTRTAVYFGLSALFMALSMVAWKQLSGFLDIGGDPEYAAVAQELDDNRDTPFEAAMQEGSPRLARAQATADTQQQEPLQLPAQVELANVSRHADHPEAAEVDKGVPRWLSTPFTLLGVSSDSMRQLYTTYRETSTYAMIGAVVMGQTLAVFPPLTEAIVSSPQSWLSLGSALTAWHFLVFNLGDYFGRFMTQWIHCRNSRWLHIVNAARTALVPVFLLIPTHALPEETHVLLVVIRSDIVFLMLVFVLGWTNGWVATMALILGPQRAVNKEVAGSILGFSLGIGLVFGAIASYPILAIAGIS
ncbi:hypothetical protein GGI07_002522 [Coemansia sp. Benny D115]|nr:hypothetical protein GGI07_002522 [Coemansia sp. Benny D115]